MSDRRRLLCGVIAFFTMVIASVFNVWSIFAKSIAEEFPQWTGAQLSMTFTIAIISFCAGQLLSGMFAKKITMRTSSRIASVLFLTGFFVVSRCEYLAELYLGFGLLCGLASGLLYNAVMRYAVVWFPNNKGFASGALLTGYGLGSFIIGLIYEDMNSGAAVGAWKYILLKFGIAIFVLLIVFSFLFPAEKRRLRETAKATPAQETAKRGGSAFRVLKQKDFWVFYLFSLCFCVISVSITSQASGIVREVCTNITLKTVAVLVGTISIFNGLGRLVAGRALDKQGLKWTLQFTALLFLLAMLVLKLAIVAQSQLVLILGLPITGFAIGCAPTCTAMFVNSRFGEEDYSVDYPLLNTHMMIGAFASTLSGALYDASNSYSTTITLLIVISVIAYLLYRYMFKRPAGR